MTVTQVNPALRTYKTLNPATGELVREWPHISDSDLETALAKAHEAFLEWRLVPIEKRVELFLKFADVLTSHTDALAYQTAIEMGKIKPHAAMEVEFAAQMFTYYAKHGPALLADEEVDVPGMSKTILAREPIGVVLGIEPWNAPIFQPMRATAPNLFLGNTVLMKPAEICAGTTLLFDDMFIEAGFPEGLYQTVLASTDQCSTLIADPRVRAVTLTGSDRAGSAVGAQASAAIKPVVLELGGSDAFVVLDDADVQKAAAVGAMCRLILGGQACALPKRVIVTHKVADEFIEAYLPTFTSQVVGDPLDPATTMGPMSSTDAAELLQAQLDDAIAKGATVLVAGGRQGDTAFFTPAVITDITKDMRVYSEEAFGPLGVIYRVANADEAIELANDTKYGLGGVVFSENLDEAKRVARLLDTGGVGINTFLGAPVEVAFGGTKSSGVGRELGKTGMDPFANFKTYGYSA